MSIDQPDLDYLRAELDASFGGGPSLRTPVDRATAGRAALRRRRRSAVVGSAAAVAVVVAASFAVLGPDGTRQQGTDPVAPAPSVAPPSGAVDEDHQAELDRLAAKASAHAEKVRKARLVTNQFPAALDNDGSLVIRAGWRVTQQVEEPVGLQPPEKSLGVVVTDGTKTLWMLLTLDGNGGSASADPAGKGYSRYEDWLASMVAISGGPAVSPLVTVTETDDVVAGPGSTLVDVQEVPVVEGYTAPGDRVAQVRRDGRVWFVVVRGHGSTAELIPVDADVLPDSTLDALLTYLAQQTESGEGVR